MKSLKSVFFIFTAAILILRGSAWAAPSEVVIIRHAEKPATGNELSPQGFDRASLLPQFFQNNPVVNAGGPVVAIYAMAPDGPDGSLRPIETVTPLAEALGLTIQEEYTQQQIEPMVDKIMRDPDYDGHRVVVCWEHTVIPEMAKTFGATHVPDTWPDSVFDVAWVLRFDASGAFTQFTQVDQDLLPGDRQTLLSTESFPPQL